MELDEATLFKALLDAPDDAGPRAVFADWLLERGDAMAEFVELQSLPRGALDRLKQQRVQDLLIMNWKRWVGTLSRVLRRRSSTFVRGFLEVASVELSRDGDMPPGLADDWHWATVRELSISGPPERVAEVLQSRWLKNLRALHCGGAALELVKTPSFRLARLELESAANPSSAWNPLERLTFHGTFDAIAPRLTSWKVGELFVSPGSGDEVLGYVERAARFTGDVGVIVVALGGQPWARVVPQKQVTVATQNAHQMLDVSALKKRLGDIRVELSPLPAA